MTGRSRHVNSPPPFSTARDDHVAKPELGAKRLCQACGAKYYDLMRDPIVCPKCGATFVAVALVSSAAALRAAKAEAARAKAAKAADDLADKPEEADEDLDTISLDEADDEVAGAGDKVIVAEDEDEETEDAEDATFLEPDEDADEDVTDIIGDREKDDET